MPADDLLLLEGMSPDLALALARRGVRTREDLAEQSVDDSPTSKACRPTRPAASS